MKRKGRKLGNWIIRASGKTYEVPYYMDSKDPSYPKFWSRCDELDLEFEGTDIGKVRAAMHDAISREVQLDWKPMLHLVFNHTDHPTVSAISVSIVHLCIAKGANGDDFFKSGAPTDMNRSVCRGKPGGDGRHGDETCVMIEDTPQHRKGIDRLISALQSHHQAVLKLMATPEIASQTLLSKLGPAYLIATADKVDKKP